MRVFIDGSSGTTGLQIAKRLAADPDLELIRLSEGARRDPTARREALNAADIAFLCLPDAAAIEAVDMVQNSHTAIIDTSTAHRVSDGWVYGFPELSGQRERIRASKRVANPGCHASGFIALIAPLRQCGLLPADAALTCFSLTGYSGGGKKMIAQYREDDRSPLLSAPRQYGLGQSHKHLPEMQALCGLTRAPLFCPIVADYFSGMEVSVPLYADQLLGTPAMVREAYRDLYTGPVIRFADEADEDGFLSAGALSGRDSMEISVSGNDERLVLTARFDNLGKGASGAAIQNMNILLGRDECAGLVL